MAISDSAKTPVHVQFDPVLNKCTVRNAAELPEEVFEWADKIEILDASFGHLRTLPDRLADIKKLRVAFFSHNDFDVVPDVLAKCEQLEMVGFKSCQLTRIDARSLPNGLRGLILTDNAISTIFENIGELQQLEKLMLTGNRLCGLPDTLLNCRNLQLLRVAMNQLRQFPDQIFSLPRLAWYSDGQNSYSISESGSVPTTEIKWHDLIVGEVIGRSAKNTVYEVQYRDRLLAVKVFGSGTTTDGSPADDIRASLVAGEHPHIIGAIDHVTDAPHGQQGLLMPRIPAEYQVLGQPPDFSTLVRDVYPSSMRFSPDYVHRVAKDMAEALTHLANKGIQHGDVYAHNILTREDGRSILGDFGAASMYDPTTAAGRAREKADVLAYGVLLGELLSRTEEDSTRELHRVHQACVHEDPGQRPTFRDIAHL